MPRLSAIIDDFAERFSFEKTKVASLARVMREAGLITSGARGVNAPPATSLDAARLLLAMMLDSKLATVAEDVAIVGTFTVLDRSQLTPGFQPTNLEDGIVRVFEFVAKSSSDQIAEYGFNLSITPWAALAEIMIGIYPEDESQDTREIKVSFSHPDIDPNNITNLPEAYYAASRRFPVGFQQTATVHRDHLISIGRLIADAEK